MHWISPSFRDCQLLQSGARYEGGQAPQEVGCNGLLAPCHFEHAGEGCLRVRFVQLGKLARVRIPDERVAYKDALPHAVDAPDGGRLEDAADQQQPPADTVLVLVVPAGGLDMCLGDSVLGLGNANDHHHLVVRPDDVPVDALGLGVDGAAALIVELVVAARVFGALPLNHIVVWRPALRFCQKPE